MFGVKVQNMVHISAWHIIEVDGLRLWRRLSVVFVASMKDAWSQGKCWSKRGQCTYQRVCRRVDRVMVFNTSQPLVEQSVLSKVV